MGEASHAVRYSRAVFGVVSVTREPRKSASASPPVVGFIWRRSSGAARATIACSRALSVTPSLDALLGRSASRREHSAVVTWAQARGHLLWGSGAGRRVLRIDVHPGPPARGEDHGDATIRRHLVLIGALDLLGGEGEHSARDGVGRAPGESHDRMVLLPAQRLRGLVLDLHGGFGEAGQHVALAGQSPAESGELDRLELQRPVRKEKLRLVHVVLSLSRLVYSP